MSTSTPPFNVADEGQQQVEENEATQNNRAILNNGASAGAVEMSIDEPPQGCLQEDYYILPAEVTRRGEGNSNPPKEVATSNAPDSQLDSNAVGISDAASQAASAAAAAATTITNPKGLSQNSGPNTKPGATAVFDAPTGGASMIAAETTTINPKGLSKNSGPDTNRATRSGVVGFSTESNSGATAAITSSSPGLRQSNTKGQLPQTTAAAKCAAAKIKKGLRSANEAATATAPVDGHDSTRVVGPSGTTTIPSATTMPALRGLGKNQGPDGSSTPSPVPAVASLPTTRGLSRNNSPKSKRKQQLPESMNVPTMIQQNVTGSELNQAAENGTPTTPALPSSMDGSAQNHSLATTNHPPTPPTYNNTGLAVARAIEDVSADDTFPDTEAKPYDVEAARRKTLERSKQHRTYLFVLALIFVCIVLGVILGVVFHSKNKDPGKTQPSPPPSPTVVPTYTPSESPSSAPSGALDLLRDDLPEHTLASLNSFDTPQWKAWDWLMNHKNISNFEEWRKKQLFALATIYYAFQGENWNELIREKWLDYDREECLWFSSGFGYFCQWLECSVNGRSYAYGEYIPFLPANQMASCNEGKEFTSLHLENLQLSEYNPSMPPEVALLTSLSTINLRFNHINASLSEMFPTALAQLRNLTRVNFELNDLHGTIPTVLGMISLTVLELRVNSLTGTLPSELGTMTNLQELTLHTNSLTGSILSDLGLMTSMTLLGLSDLTGSIPSELGMMTKLEWLSLHGNYLTGTIPKELGLMTGMKDLFLGWNSLTGSVPFQLGLMTGLKYFSLSWNSLTGPLPSELGSMRDMEILDLDINSFGMGIPSELGLMTNLKRLGLEGNALTGTLPSELGMITSLEWLSLFDNALTGRLPTDLTSMTRLTDLSLFSNRLTGTIPSELVLVSSLLHLDLSENDLSGPLPTELGLMTSLTTLKLNSNSFNGPVPSDLGLITSMTRLILSNNKLAGSLPSEVARLTDMKSIELEMNSISGSVPSQLALLTNLEILTLNNNSLNGTIPLELQTLRVNGSLSGLILANNFFTGTIPDEFCSMGLFNTSSWFSGGLSFDCNDQLCGCCWCPCQDSNQSSYCQKNPWLDDEWPGQFPAPGNGSNAITINLRTDEYPEDTSFEWSALNGSGTWEVQESGSPTGASSLNSYTMEVEPDSFYRLQIFDSFGDGTCCSAQRGFGWFTILNSTPSDEHVNGTVLWETTGDVFGYLLEVFIGIDLRGNAHHLEHKPTPKKMD